MYAFHFLPVADRYSIDGLKKYASYTISTTLDPANVVDIYVDAVTKLPLIGKNFNPFMTNGLAHHYLLGESTFIFKFLFQFLMKFV